MKLINIFKGAMVGVLALSMVSCEDFLNRPTEDNYNVDNFYKTDDQVEQGVNFLYNSPWYDFQRAFRIEDIGNHGIGMTVHSPERV